MSKRIKVLIIDDSALVRSLLTDILANDSDIWVVGAAQDPYEAREMIKKLNPDVLTLDIEMPKMNGITFLANLMRLRPMPVVMISTLTQAGAPATLEALEIGAVDFLAKPKQTGSAGLEEYGREIIDKVKAAAGANVHFIENKTVETKVEGFGENKRLKAGFLCAIGASTGGTEAIKDVLKVLPKNSPPIVVTQHIPGSFSRSFAERVDKQSEISVLEAENNMPIRAGCAYIAPGDYHMKVAKSAYGFVCKLEDSDPVNRHKPSVEVLFDSVLETVGKNATVVMLTGMGADGAQAMKRTHDAGCHTIVQDEATSVVWGMPGAAAKLGAAKEILPLNAIPRAILQTSFR